MNGKSETTDLCARLRGPISTFEMRELCNGAADEIERLRATLRRIADSAGKLGEKGTTGEGHSRCIGWAMEALQDAA